MPKRETSTWITANLAEQFGLSLDNSALPSQLTGGLQHEVWKAATSTGDVVFKRQTAEPNLVAIELEEAASLGDVACAGLIYVDRQSPFIRQFDGNTEYFIRAYHYIKGQMLDRTSVHANAAYAIGEELALLHSCSQLALQDQLHTALSASIANYYDITELPDTIRDQVKPYTTDFDISKRRAIIGHRDVSGKNIILEASSGKPYFIDFDEAGLTTVDGEIVDAAFNLAGVHTPDGPKQEIVQAFIQGYHDAGTYRVDFDILSFHMLIGMSEYWWLGVCLNRIKDSRLSADNLEQNEVARLTTQLPKDLAHLPAWLTWLQ